MVNLMPGAYFQVLGPSSDNFLDVIENSYNVISQTLSLSLSLSLRLLLSIVNLIQTTSQTVELAPSPAQGVEFSINASCAK